MYLRQAIKTTSEEQIRKAMDLIAQKGLDAQVLMYDMQNSSTADYNNADIREWLAGMTDYGYITLIERLGRR
jgi:H2-forming N5,N10-methylenetetrahydromethanopterin dehydrogenase-like enzyme